MTTWAEAAAQMIEVVSRLASLEGELQAWSTGTATGGPSGDGRYPFTQPDGTVTLVPCVAVIARADSNGPEAFGAIGDGASHRAGTRFPTLAALQAVYPFATSLAQEMDWLGWQAMINTFGVFRCPRANYVMCNADPGSWVPLSWCAGMSDVDGSYGHMDWSALRYQVATTHMMANYNFATADGWDNSHDYDNQPGWIIYMSFTKGYAEGIDDKGQLGARNPYYEIHHPITLPPGRYRAVMKGRATRGVSYHFGNGNPPYCTMHTSGGFTDRSVTVFPALDPTNPEITEVPFTGQFDFEVKANVSGGMVFKGGGYVNIKLDSLDVIPFIPNCAILNHRDGPVDHYFTSRRLRNIQIRGPYNDLDNAGLSCGLWKSFSSIDGSLQDWDGIKIFGFDMPLNWQDGAYLINYYGCDLESRGRGCYFGAGSVNAGENIKFYWGSVSGGKCAFTNPGGAEITLFGTIVDYNEQLCVENAGKIRLVGTRHEQHVPTDATKPIWHCTTGRVIYDDVYFLGAGGVGTSPCPPARLDTHAASIEFHGCEVYNLSSVQGVAASGAGRIHFFGFLNNGNPNIGPDLLSTNKSMDLLGSGGTFEPQPSGTSSFYHTDHSGIGVLGGINDSDAASVMIDAWNSTNLKCAVSSDYSRSGTRSLKVTKVKGQNNNVYSQVYFMVPLPSPGNLLGRMYLSFPEQIQATAGTNPDGTVLQYPIYFRQFYVQVLRYDSFGRPVISERTQFKGEDDIYIDGTGEPGQWRRKSLNTTYGQPSPDENANDRSPEWATHYMIAIDIQNMPAMSFYIDDLQINFLG